MGPEVRPRVLWHQVSEEQAGELAAAFSVCPVSWRCCAGCWTMAATEEKSWTGREASVGP